MAAPVNSPDYPVEALRELLDGHEDDWFDPYPDPDPEEASEEN